MCVLVLGLQFFATKHTRHLSVIPKNHVGCLLCHPSGPRPRCEIILGWQVGFVLRECSVGPLLGVVGLGFLRVADPMFQARASGRSFRMKDAPARRLKSSAHMPRRRNFIWLPSLNVRNARSREPDVTFMQSYI